MALRRMDMLSWKDTTSYSQNEKERTPRTWRAEVGRFEVIVTRVIHFDDIWFLRIRSLGIEQQLNSKDISYAKREAELILKMGLQKRIDEMKEAIKDIDSTEVHLV
jgi:hypothetical protein